MLFEKLHGIPPYPLLVTYSTVLKRYRQAINTRNSFLSISSKLLLLIQKYAVIGIFLYI